MPINFFFSAYFKKSKKKRVKIPSFPCNFGSLWDDRSVKLKKEMDLELKLFLFYFTVILVLLINSLFLLLVVTYSVNQEEPTHGDLL